MLFDLGSQLRHFLASRRDFRQPLLPVVASSFRCLYDSFKLSLLQKQAVAGLGVAAQAQEDFLGLPIALVILAAGDYNLLGVTCGLHQLFAIVQALASVFIGCFARLVTLIEHRQARQLLV